ncbi:MAG: hypothetical protein ACRYG4_18845, partial [Janthinobacterium lividum]
LMGGVLTGSVIAGRVASTTHKYKPVLITGSVVTLVAVALLLQVGPGTSQNALLLRLALLGLGLGPAQGMFTLAIQSAVEPRRVGVATASAQFFRQIGSTIGVALFGAILTNTLTAELPRRAPDLVRAGSVDMSHAQLLAMNPAALRTTLAASGVTDPDRVKRTGDGIRASFSTAILGLFPISAILFLGAFVITLMVPGLRLRGREETGEMIAIEAGAPAE